MRLKESNQAKQDRGHGTRQFPAADVGYPKLGEPWEGAGFQVGDKEAGGSNGVGGPSFNAATHDRTSRLAHHVCLALFLVQFAVVLVRLWTPSAGFWHGHWPEAILLITATAATLSSLARELPLQNMLLAGGLLALAGLGLESLNAALGVPFGRIRFSPAAGPLLFDHVPWCMPFAWVASLLTARGVARFLLAPLRTNPRYGFYVLGLTVLFVSGFNVSFQSLAVRIGHYWSWSSGPLFRGWVETPGMEWLSRAVTTLVTMALVTPILIDKRPTPQRPLAFPLVLWLLLLVLFLTATGVNRLWSLFSIGLFQIILIAGLAWYRFQRPRHTPRNRVTPV
jgi:uncharacterized membrane protein